MTGLVGGPLLVGPLNLAPIRPRETDGLFCQSQSAHGALKYRRNAHKVTGRQVTGVKALLLLLIRQCRGQVSRLDVAPWTSLVSVVDEEMMNSVTARPPSTAPITHR